MAIALHIFFPVPTIFVVEVHVMRMWGKLALVAILVFSTFQTDEAEGARRRRVGRRGRVVRNSQFFTSPLFFNRVNPFSVFDPQLVNFGVQNPLNFAAQSFVGHGFAGNQFNNFGVRPIALVNNDNLPSVAPGLENFGLTGNGVLISTSWGLQRLQTELARVVPFNSIVRRVVINGQQFFLVDTTRDGDQFCQIVRGSHHLRAGVIDCFRSSTNLLSVADQVR